MVASPCEYQLISSLADRLLTMGRGSDIEELIEDQVCRPRSDPASLLTEIIDPRAEELIKAARLSDERLLEALSSTPALSSRTLDRTYLGEIKPALKMVARDRERGQNSFTLAVFCAPDSSFELGISHWTGEGGAIIADMDWDLVTMSFDEERILKTELEIFNAIQKNRSGMTVSPSRDLLEQLRQSRDDARGGV